MVSKASRDTIATNLLYYNTFSLIYIPLAVFGCTFFIDLYDIVDLNGYYPLILVLGEYFKTYYLWKNNHINQANLTSRELFKSALLCLLSTVVFDVLEVCAGAPFVENQSRTLSLAIMLTILTVFPSCLTLGFDETVELTLNISTYNGDPLNNIIMTNICATLIGAWLGAIVIPLDWDRPWQVWPIPCYFGGLMGNMIGNLMNIVLQGQNKRHKHSFIKP